MLTECLEGKTYCWLDLMSWRTSLEILSIEAFSDAARKFEYISLLRNCSGTPNNQRKWTQYKDKDNRNMYRSINQNICNNQAFHLF